MSAEAIETLKDLLNHPDVSVKIRACELLLAYDFAEAIVTPADGFDPPLPE